MLTEKDIAESLLHWQGKLKTVDHLSELLTEWKRSLEEGVNALRSLNQLDRAADAHENRFKEATQLSFPGLGLPDAIETAVHAIDRNPEDGKKPDVQIIEEIFREWGPLHVTDLVPIGQSRGVSFQGSKKPVLMARDKMCNCKRFHLFGNNVWGLPNQELPQRYKQRTSGRQLAAHR